MKTKAYIIKGIASSIIIEETTDTDTQGERLFLLVQIFVATGNKKTRVGASRLPNAKSELKKELKTKGIQLFRHFERLAQYK